jgi:hypothetical protein
MIFRKIFYFMMIYMGLISLLAIWSTEYLKVHAADSNTVSSTVVTDKSVPTASAPSVVVNNSDVCKSAAAASVQTQVLGISTGITITDEVCQRIKLSRSLFGMGMKVAAVSHLCGDGNVFTSMWMAGTPCPFMGKIGDEAKAAWEKNPELIPEDSEIKAIVIEQNTSKEEVKPVKVEKKKEPTKRPLDNEGTKHMWFKPLGAILMLLLI